MGTCRTRANESETKVSFKWENCWSDGAGMRNTIYGFSLRRKPFKTN